MPAFRSEADAFDFIAGFYTRENYRLFDDPKVDFDLNFGGARLVLHTDRFDDVMWCLYRRFGQKRVKVWRATTDPSLITLKEPSHSRGAGIMCPGQHRSLWTIDKHGGKYDALCHRGAELPVYRDADRDARHEFDPASVVIETSSFNGHRASEVKIGESVGPWSAACQVWQDPDDFEEAMWLARQQVKHHPTWTHYTYTLFTAQPDPRVRHHPELAELGRWVRGYGV